MVCIVISIIMIIVIVIIIISSISVNNIIMDIIIPLFLSPSSPLRVQNDVLVFEPSGKQLSRPLLIAIPLHTQACLDTLMLL